MKVAKLLIVLLCAVCTASSLRAQMVPYDSLAANIVLPFNVDFPNNALGNPDNKQAKLKPTGNLDVAFQTNGRLTTINAGSMLHIYWNKEIAQDSSAAFLTFIKYTDSYIELGRKDTVLINKPGMTTVTAPDGGFNGLDFTLTGGQNFGGSVSFYLDAVTLLQSGTAAVKPETAQSFRLSSYPNPFVLAAGTSLHLLSTVSGKGLLHVYDMLGREISVTDLGMIATGEQEIKVNLTAAGIYFARLSVDGSFVGNPLKLSAE